MTDVIVVHMKRKMSVILSDLYVTSRLQIEISSCGTGQLTGISVNLMVTYKQHLGYTDKIVIIFWRETLLSSLT